MVNYINKNSLISHEIPDWSREEKRFFEWMPSKSLIASIRKYQSYKNDPSLLAFVLSKAHALRYRFWSVVTGADIPIECNIGGGLVMPHPNGIVIHSNVSIGPNCLIFQQVTLGWSGGGSPTLGGHVDIGAGAKVIGPIHLDHHCKVGANAVVLCNVPMYSTVVGIPGRIVNTINTY